jgi:hypothetical protein
MHRSRLSGFLIDCKDANVDVAARFWGQALGMAHVGNEGENYALLDGTRRDLHIEVQRVQHESRVHIDIETDDIDKEVARLETLGARRVQQTGSWWVLEAPTGQRFCVVRARHSLVGAAGVNEWELPTGSTIG